MKKYKISVIVPIFNTEKYLKECLDSIINQSLKDIEIICINDGSSDGSRTIVDEYRKKYQNVILIDKKNEGVINARIDGIKRARGEYIGFVDSDDYIEKSMYEKLYNLTKKNNSDVAICSYNFVPNKVVNKQRWFKEYKGKIDWKFIDKNTIQCNKIVKKSLLEKLNFEKMFRTMGEGCYSIVLIAANGVSTINDQLYNYRVGHASLSSNFKNVEWYKQTVLRKKEQYNYAKLYIADDKLQTYFMFGYLYYSLILMIVSAMNDDKKMYLYGKSIIKEGNIFSRKYYEFLLERFSKLKIIFFKYLGTKSFFAMKIISKMYLNYK